MSGAYDRVAVRPPRESSVRTSPSGFGCDGACSVPTSVVKPATKILRPRACRRCLREDMTTLSTFAAGLDEDELMRTVGVRRYSSRIERAASGDHRPARSVE